MNSISVLSLYCHCCTSLIWNIESYANTTTCAASNLLVDRYWSARTNTMQLQWALAVICQLNVHCLIGSVFARVRRECCCLILARCWFRCSHIMNNRIYDTKQRGRKIHLSRERDTRTVFILEHCPCVSVLCKRSSVRCGSS